MAVHAMIDLETLGVNNDCIILTFGAVKFDPCTSIEPHDPIHIRVDTDEQTALNRTIDDDTLEWWNKQDEQIREEALSEDDRMSLDNFTRIFNKYIVGCNYLWCKGPMFDYAILRDLYVQLDTPVPWAFWQIRDCRTLFGLMTRDQRNFMMEQQNMAHNALADAYFQAQWVQEIYKQFEIKHGN